MIVGHRRSVAAFVCCGIVLCLFLSGCQKNPLGLAPVSGTVTLNGEIVSDATVTFYPVTAEGLTASGRTDEKGVFQLNTVGGGDFMGAKPAEYQITIAKKEGFYGDIIPQTSEQQSGKPTQEYVPTPAAAKKTENLLPKKYDNKETSGLKFTVASGKNICKFDLTED